MRQSEGSLAFIERRREDRFEILTQWNDRWRAFSLVGGHRRPSESFRGCLAREVAEELGLEEGEHFTAGESPLARLEYVAHSESADVETRYTLEVYRVELCSSRVEDAVSTSPENRWVTAEEIEAGATLTGIRISSTVARVLAHLDGLDRQESTPYA